jgi:hypothetical protein
MDDDIERQSPMAFCNVGLAYVEAADELASRQLDRKVPFNLSYDLPILHLYAHGWELVQKACLREQGMSAEELRLKVRHNLTKGWDLIDKDRFAALRLTPDTRLIVEVLDWYHPTKLFAYPYTGSRRQIELAKLTKVSKRLHLSRADRLRLFSV